ncbi:MAG TPA: hypothetical protein VGX26_02875 [Solirubrobacteraceae bacterium]|jgi:uncharacterized membrane protein YccC|nr:hypothetical protein [Solirubrobacteraceae bacterium]
MNAIVYAIAMWVLLQLLFVWFCARVAAVRELDVKDYLELQNYLRRIGIQVDADEPSALPSPSAPIRRPVPPAEIARA